VSLRKVRSVEQPDRALGVASAPQRAFTPTSKRGVSLEAWSKDNHQCGAVQTGNIICFPLETVDSAWRSWGTEGLSERAKKL
jgi:hypothetical protein